MTRKRQRLLTLAACGVGLALATGLALVATQDSLVFFRSPADLAADAAQGRMVRLGGLVETGSVARETGVEPAATFNVTDGRAAIAVRYVGVLPDLFREGQGIVATGRMTDGVFVATEVLAKHDETYMPAEVADALKRSGRWKPGEAVPSYNAMATINAPGKAPTKADGS